MTPKHLFASFKTGPEHNTYDGVALFAPPGLPVSGTLCSGSALTAVPDGSRIVTSRLDGRAWLLTPHPLRIPDMPAPGSIAECTDSLPAAVRLFCPYFEGDDVTVLRQCCPEEPNEK